LIRYPDATVKKDILRFLGKINTNQSKVLIIEQLKDTDPSIVSEAVRLLGETRCEESVPALIALFNTSAGLYNLLGELCLALGAIGNHQAIPILIATMNKKPFFMTGDKDEREKVRMRAAWSLSRFSVPEVIAALEKATHDKSSAVAMTAKESLKQIQEKPVENH
ncbi:MAG: HEAT repeat domain-containing protein, partial [Endomicrobiales bacterium]